MSSTDRGTVTAGQDLRLIGPDLTVPMKADLHYSRQDPYAVRMSLDAGREEPVDWFLSRDLLAAALYDREGIGDVRAWPAPARTAAEPAGTSEKILNIELGSPDACARFEVSAAGIGAFLARTFELVPGGEESAFLDLDAGLAELLSQA
ncbi:MAG TPA: SsgA family sporulation/cell division regulator [Trebonia sp.]